MGYFLAQAGDRDGGRKKRVVTQQQQASNETDQAQDTSIETGEIN